MRVAIVSDTHSVLDPRVRDRIARYRSDYIVHAGDIGAHTVLESLSRLGALVAVRGNNDEALDWAHGLPDQASISLPGGLLVVRHGHAFDAKRRHQRLRSAHSDARAVAYGHSHVLAIDTTARPWILNPGAAGRVRTKGGPSCLLLSATEKRWRVTPVRFPHES